MTLQESKLALARAEACASSVSLLTEACFSLSWNAGWWASHTSVYSIITDTFYEGSAPRETLYPTKIALIHSEISEALEGLRTGRADAHLPSRPSVEVELADACIRIFDLAGAMGLDLGGAIFEKLQYNQTRLDHRPEKRAKEGGKKF